MGRFKDFDAAEAERQREPITFRLGGREWNVIHVDAASFLAFSRQIAEGGNAVVLGFDDYIHGSLAEDERDDFRAMLAESHISLPTLIAVGTWIVEQASGNPTADVSLSQPAPSRTGEPPRVVSLWPASTPEGSASAAG